MNYYENKVPGQTKVDPTHLGEIYKEWITELQDELKKAGRQVDRLERKLLLRSRKLGDARAEAKANADFCCDFPVDDALPVNDGW